MIDILGLAGWEVISVSQDGSQCVIDARYTVQPEACQKCGVVGNLYKHGAKTATYRDLPVRISPTVIRVDAQRYRCRDCGETFVPPMFGIEPTRRMTIRCVEFIREQCLRKTFTALAEFVGCTEGTIRNIASEKVAMIAGGFYPYLPEWLGIDETMLAGEMRCILTDVRNRLPVDILPNRDKATVINWLWQFREAKHIKGIAMDMWRPYKDAARAVFPSLPVVIDKFHVVRMANTALDKVRIRTQKDRSKAVRVSWKRSKHQLLMRPGNLSEEQRFNLQMWLDNEPDIAAAYSLKEDFFAIYDMSKGDAIAAYDEFLKSVPASMKSDFGDLTRAMKNWREEILTYFDHRITNGYTEALNGVAKVISRQGRGYGYDIIRGRILQQHASRRPRPDGLSRTIYQERHQMLIEALGSQCESCGGVFDGDDLVASSIPPVLKDQRWKRGYLCPRCRARFHTGDANHGNQVSTPDYE